MWWYPLRADAAEILSSTFPHPLLSRMEQVVDLNTLALAGDGGLLGALARLTDPRAKRGIRHRVAANLPVPPGRPYSWAPGLFGLRCFCWSSEEEALAVITAEAGQEGELWRSLDSLGGD